MENKFNKSIKNVIWGILGQVITLALSFIVPRLILVNYGSEINGLTNTISQIYTYVALLEAGIGQSAMFALYHSKSHEQSSSILAAAKKQYRRTAYVFVGCVVLLTIVLPFLIKTELKWWYVLLITLMAGIPSVLSFLTTAAYSQLLAVDGKHYVGSNLNLCASCVSSIAKIILANLQINILILQLAFCLISCSKTLFYVLYFRNHYTWIDNKAIPDESTFVDRKGYVKTSLAWVVFSNTDVLLISVLCDLKMASVYAVYNMVFSAIYSLLNQLYTSTSFVLGHEYNKSISSYISLHDSFDAFFDMIVCAVMSVTYILILPFVRIYTSGITDVEYIYSELPLLFCSVQILSWIRYVSGNLTSLAGHAKKIGNISVIETIINVASSVVLIYFFGIAGALMGTIIALLFKSIYIIIFANKCLNRSSVHSFKICLSNIFLFGCVVLLNEFLKINPTTYGSFILYGVILSFSFLIVFYLFNLVINKKETLLYTSIFCRKVRILLKRG